MDILDLLASDNYIPYNRTLAKELGIEPAILFGALCGYQRHYKMQEFFREQEKIIDDTCLSEYTIRQSTKILQDKGLIIVKKKGLPAKNYYQINTTRLIEYLSTSGCEIDTTGDYENNTTRNNENITTNNKIENKTKNKIDNKILIKENKKESQQDTINSYNFSQSINEIINDWLTYKKEKGQTYKSIGLTKMLNSIVKGIKEFGEQAVIDSINKAMESNYAGFFIKGKTYQKPQQHQHLVIDHEQLDKDYAKFVGTYIGGDE